MSQQESFSSKVWGPLGDMKPRDYWNVARRRKWWIVVSTITVFVSTTVVALLLPDIYRAEAVILIEAQRVSDSYVASTVTSNLQDRLLAIQQQVLSPPRVKKLIDTVGLYPKLRDRLSTQTLISLLRKNTEFVMANSGERPMSSFSVAFRGENAVQVAQVTNHLATMFLEENMKVREQQSFGTSEFLKTELQETKKQLEEKEKEIQQVKSQFILDLPESKQYNLEILTNLRSQLRDSQERLSHAQQEKLLVQAMASSSAPTVDLDSGLQGSPYQSEIDKLEARISELRVRYGETYPNVRKLQSELDRLKAKAAANEIKAPVLATAPKGRRNPVLEAQLQKLNDEIENQKKLQTQLQGQINFHVSKLERVPVFEQKISGTMREYDTMLNHYRSVLDKKLSAEMGNDLETRQKAERFLILEPAVVPEKPFGLHRLLIILAGLVGGLAGGIGLALAVEIADESVRNDHEAAEISRQPVLAVIPHISTTQELRLNRMRAFGAVAATTIGSVILGLLVSFVTRRWL